MSALMSLRQRGRVAEVKVSVPVSGLSVSGGNISVGCGSQSLSCVDNYDDNGSA